MAGTMSAARDPRTVPDTVTDDARARPAEGAGGVVFDAEGRVLVIRNHKGEWLFPKGHLDPGETLLQAALREVKEEAGITATCPDPGARWTTSYRNDRGQPRRITWFRLQAPRDATPVMHEAQFPEGIFMPPDRARARLSFPVDRDLLDRVLQHTPSGASGGPP